MTTQHGETNWSATTLIGGFALVAVALTVIVVTLAGGGLEELGYAFGGGIAVAIGVIGAYAISNKKGLPHSHSVAIAGVALGVMYMIALAVRLLTEFGA